MIALGANLPSPAGGPADTLRAALASLPEHGLRLTRQSRFYATPCFPEGAGPDYVNACAVLDGPDDPAQVLAALHAIEAEHGRARLQRWGSRSLDLDFLAMGDRVLPDATSQAAWRALTPGEQRTRTPDRLILPHPRLQDRAFVLVPLCDVAPDWRHPLLGQSVRALCGALPETDRAAVRPL
ncbi:2-amino-4-hydroxy-6-hydroxymethyldihydropteridine diphosphokinase [Salipiger abyssi]|uniref:2-amino-4-hydroxy-6- hydroxymethyldihydropteridine diphosphokinase n=1 Tax=Salipiger abyssi TaxID=1250539 RepID=UPI001F28E675|nr:2-amino-4-hydroxy-6-hydroxymethyldihydropteridine diphosphokinase [Salipiger abyssi]